MNNVSFTSKISLIENSFAFEYQLTKLMAKNKVEYPWTPKEIKKGNLLATTGIYDCVAGGITDGHDVVMFHLCPYSEVSRNYFDFKSVEKDLLSKINLKKTLQGFVVGCETSSHRSVEMLNNVKKFMENFNVPTTFLTGNRCIKDIDNGIHILYSAPKETWYVASKLLSKLDCSFSSMDILKKKVEHVEISKFDKLI